MTEKSIGQRIQEIIKQLRKDKPDLDCDQPFNVCLFPQQEHRDRGFLRTCNDLEKSLEQLFAWQNLEPSWFGEILYYGQATGITKVVYKVSPT